METTIGRRRDRGHDPRYSDATGLESDLATMHPLISWRSVVAGLLIAFFTLLGLMGLGLAFGGIGLDEDTSARSAGIFSGVWFLASVLISLFVGSYFAARVSKFQTGRIGSAQGLVIAALFVGIFLYQTMLAVGNLGSAAGSFLGKSASMVGAGAQKAVQNPAIPNSINQITEDALGDLNFRSEPQAVATGVAGRLLRGDAEGAKNFLARQSGISPLEADVRIAQLRTRVDRMVDDAKQGAATALRSSGWTLVLLVVLGALSAIWGGALGSAVNFRKPLSREQHVLRQSHA